MPYIIPKSKTIWAIFFSIQVFLGLHGPHTTFHHVVHALYYSSEVLDINLVAKDIELGSYQRLIKCLFIIFLYPCYVSLNKNNHHNLLV